MAGDEKDLKVAAAGRPVEETESRPANGILEVIRTWAPAIIAVLLIRTFIFEPFRIPSGSMVPTLLIGDHVVVTKFSYGVWLPFIGKEILDIGDPERGDVIVFRYPRDPSLHYIKRVVGIPGDKISVRNNRVILNGVEQPTLPLGDYPFVDDNCAQHQTRHFAETLSGVEHSILTNPGLGGPLADMPERVIPPKSVFVMGDNRDNSEDSRKWGQVRFDQIKGKAHRIWLSWDGCASSIRTERFMRSLYERPVAGP